MVNFDKESKPARYSPHTDTRGWSSKGDRLFASNDRGKPFERKTSQIKRVEKVYVDRNREELVVDYFVSTESDPMAFGDGREPMTKRYSLPNAAIHGNSKLRKRASKVLKFHKYGGFPFVGVIGERVTHR